MMHSTLMQPDVSNIQRDRNFFIAKPAKKRYTTKFNTNGVHAQGFEMFSPENLSVTFSL